VDQRDRHLVGAILDDDGERDTGVVPDDALFDWPYWTFNAEQYFLARVVAWLVAHGGMRGSWGQCCADHAFAQRYQPLAHRQQLLAYVVQLGQQAVEACPYLAREAVAPGGRPVPSQLHEPVAKQAAADLENARALVQSLKLPAVGPPSGPELTCRPIAGLASERDAVAPGCLQHEVMRHYVTLAAQHHRQWTNGA
ncbi:unnamed protein product, partial [Prorocentrum cordatum]